MGQEERARGNSILGNIAVIYHNSFTFPNEYGWRGLEKGGDGQRH